MNTYTTQSVRNNDNNWQGGYHQLSQRNTQNQRNLQGERRMRTSLLTGREQIPRNHMSRSVGILPNMQRKISKTPKRQDQFNTENNGRYPGKGINRSMTGLDMSRNNQGYNNAKKFSDVPENWAHKTMDYNRPRGSHLSQNIVSFKKDASYENDFYNRSHRGISPQIPPHPRLRTVQSNLSHIMRSPNQINPAYEAHQQPISSMDFQNMQSMSISRGMAQKRTSIDSDINQQKFPQFQSSPSQMDLLNTSQTIAPSVYMNPEPRSFSEEDMEHRLTLLFRKILVFSSKIDSLKEKIIINNPDFSSYRLFVRFSGDKKTKMDLMGLVDFFQAFNFNFGVPFIEKIMIFLSKYQLNSQSSFAEGMGKEDFQDPNFDPFGANENR